MTKYEITLKTKKGNLILNEVGDSEDVITWGIIAKRRGYILETKETNLPLVEVTPIKVNRGKRIENPFK